MKILIIALALFVVGLSPSPCFGQTDQGSGNGSVTLDRLVFQFRYDQVFMNLYFSNVTERNPFLYNGHFGDPFHRPYDIDAPCFLNKLIFKNTNTSETFQADCPGSCTSNVDNHVNIRMDPRDYLRMVSVEFINTTSTSATSTNIALEMYTLAALEAPFYVRIQPNDTFQCDVTLNFWPSVRISYFDYWINEDIVIIHFNLLIDVATVNTSKLSLSRESYDQYGNNTVNITGGEILNESPGLTQSVAIRLTSSDRALLTSKGICTAGGVDFIQDCYLSLEGGFTASYFGEESSYFRGYSVSNFGSRAPNSEPVTMSIQLEYVGGLTLNLTLGLGQPHIIRSYNIGERVISVTCTSEDTSQYVNPMLEIDNGAVSIPDNYIQNDWPSSTTLTTPRGLYEHGLQGYYTCRTEGDTFLSPHILHSNEFRIFFYEGPSATGDLGEDIVLRFAHSDLYGRANSGFRFQVSTVIHEHYLPYGGFGYYYGYYYGYSPPQFAFRVELNTPFPYHAELHINRTQFDYEGEYFLFHTYFNLYPSFIIDVNDCYSCSRINEAKPELTLYPPVLTVLNSDPPDTTASLTCTSDNTAVPVVFPGNFTSLGITTTYLDDTNSSVRLNFELDKDLIELLDGMEFICEARDPDDNNSTVSTSGSTFRAVSDTLTLYGIEPDSSRKLVTNGETIDTTSSFECLRYINPTRTNLETIPATLLWRLNLLESKAEIEFSSDVSGEEFIVTTLPNSSITLNILGGFSGSVSCIYGDEIIKINVVTQALVAGVDFIPPFFPENGVQLFKTDDGCSQRIYSSTGIPFGAETQQYVHVCTNGMLTVGTPPLFLGTAQERFPTSDVRISQSNLLAPFWNDHDGRDPASNVKYRVYGGAAGDPDNYMNVVSSFISNQIDAEIVGKFEPTWMLVASWDYVPPYPHTATERGRNSFETIIVTDGVISFAVYSYNCDDLQWGESQNGDYSTIGYNINPGSYFGSDSEKLSSFHDHRISNLPMSQTIACSSLARGSRYHNEVYYIGRSMNTTQLARAECTNTINNDTVYSDIINGTTLRDGCPCNLAQAFRDFAFRYIDMYELTLDPVYNNQFCFTPSFSQTDTILCCYRRRSGSLNNARGISGVVAYSPSFFPNQFLETDYKLRDLCSIGGEADTLYRTRRPPVTCTTYQPPRRTFCTGDPHLTNLDGAKFTFNGWGEYILLELETDDTTFWIQARMQPLPESTTKATELGGFAFAMSRDTPVEIRLNASRQLEILISGEDVTDQLVSLNASLSTDFYTVSRSSSNSILATFPNGMGLMVNLTSMLTFTVIIPNKYRGLTRGMVGNYNGNRTDDVVFRNGTLVPLSEFSFRLLHQVGLSWQLDASESLFTYPEGMTAADYAVLNHDPPYLDEVLAAAPADILLVCGDNVECIFDSMETGDTNIGLETMNMISTIDEDEKLTSNFPPLIYGPDSLYVTLGEEAVLVFNVTDDKGSINLILVDGLPAEATLLPTPKGDYTIEYTFRLELDEIADISLMFLATDDLDAGSTLEVQIVICACENNGNCTLEGVVDQSTSTVVSNCVCPQGWEGDFCEVDVDGCANFDCFMGVDCVDVPAPGVGAVCGPCPEGYRGDGSKCADINECNDTMHGCAQLCVNQPGSFKCACYPGYELFDDKQCRDIDECSLLNGGCHHDCTNTMGGFVCSCDEGYTISTNNRTCNVDPVAMCVDSNCAQSCVRLLGVETCNCFPGYELASNEIDCSNINECEESPCEHICTDLEGLRGYRCFCQEGYQLLPGGSCTDINECLVAALDIFAADLCEPSMFCVNSVGSYRCECPAGTLLVDGVCQAEGLLTTAPPVTVREEATGNVIVVEMNGFNLYTFTLEVQKEFSAATADAINVYCDDNECPVSYPEARTRRNTLRANNLYIAEIASSGESSISFSMYARLNGGFLSGSTLATAVLAHRDEYAALGFEVTDVQTIGTEPTSLTILTTNQIIGIGVGGGLGLMLILVLIITITCCCVKGRSREPKSRARGRGLEFMNSGTGFDLKPVPHNGLEEQAVLESAEEKKVDLS